MQEKAKSFNRTLILNNIDGGFQSDMQKYINLLCVSGNYQATALSLMIILSILVAFFKFPVHNYAITYMVFFDPMSQCSSSLMSGVNQLTSLFAVYTSTLKRQETSMDTVN